MILAPDYVCPDCPTGTGWEYLEDWGVWAACASCNDDEDRPRPAHLLKIAAERELRGCGVRADFGFGMVCTRPSGHEPGHAHRWRPMKDLRELEDTHWAWWFLDRDRIAVSRVTLRRTRR